MAELNHYGAVASNQCAAAIRALSAQPNAAAGQESNGRGNTQASEAEQSVSAPAPSAAPDSEPHIDKSGGGWVPLPYGLHPDTAELVLTFAFRLAAKLHKAELKYGYSNGWKTDDWMDECRVKLNEHIAKGDPLDVAAYCAFLMWHGESTAAPDAEIERRRSGG